MPSNDSPRKKVGINGFGRIGRTIFRQLMEEDEFQVVQINDLNSDVHNSCYLLNYDSLHGPLEEKASVVEGGIVAGQDRVIFTSTPSIVEAGWADRGVEVLIESSGYKPNIPRIRECLGGSVKKIQFSDSPDNMDITIANGVNETDYDSEKHSIISSSICDVVGTAPLLHLIETRFGIKSAFLQTLHPWLNYQNIMDGTLNTDVIEDPQGKAYGIGRASPSSLIPKNTSLGKAVLKVLPSMEGKISSMSFRVPTEVVGSCTMILELKEDADTDLVKEYLISSQLEKI